MKRLSFGAGVVLFFAVARLTAQAQGTAFSHQGFLTDAGEAANGVFDLQFTPFDAATAGTAQASSNVISAIAISNGLFTVTLDFGASVFNGSARWLETAVRSNGAALKNRHTLKLEKLPRMADFYVTAVAASKALGLLKAEFENAYARNRDSIHGNAIQSSPLGMSIRRLMDDCHDWFGSPYDLLDDLSAYAQDEFGMDSSWPRNVRALMRDLKYLAPDLRAAGMCVQFDSVGLYGTCVRIRVLREDDSQLQFDLV